MIKEDLQELNNLVFKVLMVMGVTQVESWIWPLINLILCLKYGTTNRKKED